MTSVPETQKAWRAHARGEPRDVLSLDDIPVPKPKLGQALVKVEAAALNPIGYKLMRVVPNLLARRPNIVENDFAGTIIDPNGTSFKPGDKVWGLTSGGTLAQYVAAKENELALRPDNLTLEEAAGLPTVGLTAQQSIFKSAQVQPGQSVFIVGGSSSVGGIAIQILKAIGCKVYASCSSKNIDFVKSLGADVVYDYTSSPIHAQLSANPPTPKLHSIIDCIGGYDLFYHSEAYLAPNGTYVATGTALRGLHSIPSEIVGMFNALLRPGWLGGTRRKYTIMGLFPGKDDFNSLNELVKKGVKPSIDSVYEFKDTLNAYDKIMSDRAKGKVVVHVP